MPAHPHQGRPVLTAGVPVERARAAMILIHGRNAGPANILGLAEAFDRPGFAYLAPAAADRTWYPFSFLSPIDQNQPGLQSGLDVIRSLVDEVAARGVPRERIVLGGFSQGACLASEFAARHPGRYGGLIIFSGGVIGPPGTVWETTGSFEGTPAFLGCSDVDAHVPRDRVEDTARLLSRMGAAVTTRIYPGMGHLVNEDEIAWARRVMDAATTPTP